MKINNIINKNKKSKLSPVRFTLLSFLVLILIGSFLLSLPFATQNGKPVSYTDALFTSVSASCITGQVIHDTGSTWSVFGQIVILLLVQIGALGIITFTIFLTLMLGKKLSMREKKMAHESLNTFDFAGATSLIKSIIFLTLSFETVGAIILSLRFLKYFTVWKSIYYGIFHSISNFCNAGFDIMGTPENEFPGLTNFYQDPVILYTIMALILMGGLGFTVWTNIIFFKREKHFTFHTKMVLTVTTALIVTGTLAFLIIEFNNPDTIGNMTFLEKLNNSLFQSIASRNAGTNTINLTNMRELSRVTITILMFIGAAPASTGGGVKVTTLGIILALVISYIRGYENTVAFKNIITKDTIKKCICIVILSLGLIGVTTVIISTTQDTPFLISCFEATSAFSTTGMNTGAITGLKFISKVVIMISMYVGRVGPTTFALAIMMRKNKKRDTVYPEAKVIVG